MPERIILTVYGYGEIEVDLAAAFLADIKTAYESVIVFNSELDALIQEAEIDRFPPYLMRLRRVRRFVRSDFALDQIALAVPRAEQLVLRAVRLSSPGSWEFLGIDKALEVLRKYLSDRHERRKDKEYRETAEQRRLELENLLLENKVINERIEIAKKLGVSKAELASLINGLIERPLRRLDRYQDKKIIDNADIREL